MSLAPQSEDEIRPVIEALRRLDPRFDLVWNPRAITVVRPSYSVTGTRVDGQYDGRWEIVMHHAGHSLSKDRSAPVRILRICELSHGLNKFGAQYPIILDDGPYAPAGMWVIQYMQLYDRARKHARDAMEAQWRRHDEIDDDLEHDDAGHQDVLEEFYRNNGSEYWMGGAQGRAAPETLATLYADAPPSPERPSPSPLITKSTS